MTRLFSGLLATLPAAALLGAPAAPPAPDRPDVTSRGGLRVGTVFIPWGNASAVALRPSESIQPGAAACAFNTTYDMTNLGGADTAPPFTSRLRVDGTAVVATSSGLALAARETKSVATSPSLPVGTHAIELSLDDESQVAESREDNNRFRVLYSLTAPCGAAPAPRKK